MPLDQVRQEVALRLRETQVFLGEIKLRAETQGTSHSDQSLNLLKGLFFVSVYSAFEYCISRVVVETSQRVREDGVSNAHLHRAMYPLALDAQLTAAAMSGNRTKWKKRHALFSEQTSDRACVFDESAVLKELGNVWCATIDQLFEAFSLGDVTLYDIRAKQYIDEVVDNRNKVAHGRDSAANVGQTYTIQMLESRFETISREIEFIVSKFESLVDNKGYINPIFINEYGGGNGALL